jgi:hypothetical protein
MRLLSPRTHSRSTSLTSCTDTSLNIATYLVRWPVVASSTAAKPQLVDPPKWPHKLAKHWPLATAETQLKVAPTLLADDRLVW